MPALKRLFSAEIPPISERWRPLVLLYMAGFAVLYALTFLATIHITFLGPGLGDEVTLRHLIALMEQSLAMGRDHSLIWFYAFMGLLGFSTAYRGWIVYRGYSEYRRTMGEDIPLQEIVTLTITNLMNIAFAPLFLLLLAGVALLFGYRPESGWQALSTIVSSANNLVQKVPTMFELPNWLAFLCAMMIMSLLHYCLHRLSHTRRILWLLMHRPHHMTPHLCYATAIPVFMSFPLFLILAFPYIFLFGAIGKTFSSTPLYAEMILFQLVLYIGEIYGHSPALYEVAIKKRWIRWLSFLYGDGVYHILHHSAAADAERKSNNNTVNFGGCLLFFWDFVFGTYMPLSEKVPPIGLRGQPRLVMNPLRLLCAGAMQVLYELWNNRSTAVWLRIIFGASTYTPPISHDFAIHPPTPRPVVSGNNNKTADIENNTNPALLNG